MPHSQDELRRTLDALSDAMLKIRLRGESASASFPAGPSAMALAHHVLEGALPGRGHGARAKREWQRAVAKLAGGVTTSWLYGGFTGVAWVGEQLAGAGDDDGNEAIDEALAPLLARRRWTETYDVISGLVGYGIYALERTPRPAAVGILEAIVKHLAATAEEQAIGLSWRTRPAWIPVETRSRFDRGFNVGLAHGVPGVIGLLARVWRAGVATKETSRLLEGGVAWLLAQELPKKSVSAFPMFSLGDEVSAPSRSAWCYGDPGVAAALHLAARASGEPSWRRAALRIGVRAAARDLATANVQDAALCHGASGLAQIYRRLHVETGDGRFDAASRFWLDRTLAMRKDGQGVGGYLMQGHKGGKAQLVADPSFLTGTAGVAMTLTSFLGEPGGDEWAKWDRVLLLSDRPAPTGTKAKAKTKPRAAPRAPRPGADGPRLGYSENRAR